MPLSQHLNPTDLEEQTAYDLLKPASLSMSPVRWIALQVASYRERLLAPFDAFADSLPPREAAQLRALLMAARGQS